MSEWPFIEAAAIGRDAIDMERSDHKVFFLLLFLGG